MQTSHSPTTAKRWRWIAAAALAIMALGVVLWANRGMESVAPGTWSTATRKKIDDIHLAAQKYISSDQLPQAKLILEKLLKDHPDDAMGEVLMAKVLMAEGHAQAAYQHITRSLELDNSRDEIQFLAGVLAEQMGNGDLAGFHYGQAAALAPKNGRYPMYMAQLLLKKNEIEAAQVQLLRAKMLDSSLSQVFSMLAEIASRQGKPEMAIDQIDKAISQVQPDDPKHLAYTLQKAQLLRRGNQPDAALRVLMALPPKRQQQPETVEQIAQSYLMMSKPDRAAAVWTELFALDSTNQNAAAEAGLCFVRANAMDHARRYYEYARALGTDNPKVQSLQAAIQSAAKPKAK